MAGAVGGKRAQDRRHLHEVGPRADDADDRAKTDRPFVRAHSGSLDCGSHSGGAIEGTQLLQQRKRCAVDYFQLLKALFKARKALVELPGIESCQQMVQVIM